jgi:hypothetical protein
VTRSGPVRARDLAGFAAPFVPAAVAATLALRGLTQVVTAPLAGVAIAIPTALVATALGLAITRGGRRVLAETAEVARGALSSGRGAST